ncbi:amino acid deaminase/aldolase [Candidatus Uabimicrobium sp. HlEnr_7]|uniref:amino acid deaminase/aldolase n=1 Tax=Candidatus Uabimicrobium helgolandensis TaxID=3095367 RepID=UPI0035591675
MVNPHYSDYKDITENLTLPCAILDMELFEKNIKQVIARTQGKKIRIASKSIRSTQLIKHILGSDNIFQGVMCYSAEEAVHLHSHGVNDILIAYPIFDSKKIQMVCKATAQGAQITLMVDCVTQVQKISNICVEENVSIPLCIDVDMSSSFPGIHFGVRRSPINKAEQVLQLAQYIKQSENIFFNGIMGYEAQIAGLGDKNPFNNRVMNFIIRLLKKVSIKRIRRLREDIVNKLQKNGFECCIVNGGGTGSLESTSLESCVTEVTAGSAFFCPSLFDYYKNFQHAPALFYAIEVTRIPIQGIFTCHSGGFVASGVGQDKIPQPYLPRGCSLLSTEGAGEVQTPISYKGEKEIKIGSPIFMRHSKAGELCEHFNQIYLIKNKTIIKKTDTYRGEGKCFL